MLELLEPGAAAEHVNWCIVVVAFSATSAVAVWMLTLLTLSLDGLLALALLHKCACGLGRPERFISCLLAAGACVCFSQGCLRGIP